MALQFNAADRRQGISSDPGRLDRRVQLQYPVTIRDQNGSAIISWVRASDVWASRRPQNGQRIFAADEKQAVAYYLFRIRYRSDVQPYWRLVHGNEVFEIIPPLAELGRKHLLDLTCRGVNQTAGDTSTVNLIEYHTSANAAGNTTITLGSVCTSYTEVTTVTGAGSTTRAMVLAIGSSQAIGARLTHRLLMPATPGITIEWRNATATGSLITSFISDGSGDDVVAEFVFTGSAWAFLRFSAPANA